MKKLKRREFLQRSALVVAGAAAYASGVTAVAEDGQQWTAQLKNVDPHQGETLLKITRLIFPHDQLDDSYYMKAVHDLDDEAGTKPATAKLLRDGVGRLDRMTGTRFVTLSQADQITALRKIERSDFFIKVRNSELVSIYNNHDVWKKLGYPGPSYPIGGYLHHGFNDLNWLPNPPESASPKPA